MSFDIRKEKLIHDLNQKIKRLEDTIDEIDHCDNDMELMVVVLKRTKEIMDENIKEMENARIKREE